MALPKAHWWHLCCSGSHGAHRWDIGHRAHNGGWRWSQLQLQLSFSRDLWNGWHILAPILRVTLFEDCVLIERERETTPPKIYLLNCFKLNLKCMHALLLSARYAEFLLWPYDKRMQEIITNFPPARKRELNTVSTTSNKPMQSIQALNSKKKNLRGLIPCYSHSHDMDIAQQLCLRLSQSQHYLYRYEN